MNPFYYVRHGQTAWNIERRCMGQTDIPLDAVGINEAHNIKTLLQNTSIKTICHSPLTRALQTATILNEVLNCPMVAMDNLKECAWGNLEGKLKGNGDYLTDWVQGITPAGAESYWEFLKRATSGINEALAYPGPVLIVAHAGVYWAVLKMMDKDPLHCDPIPNCLPVYHHQPIQKNDSWLTTTLEGSSDYNEYELS